MEELKPITASIVQWLALAVIIFACGCFSGTGSDGNSEDPDSETGSTLQFGAFIDDVFSNGSLSVDLADGTAVAPGSAVTVTAAIVDEQMDYYREEITVSFSSTYADEGLAAFSEETVTSSSGIVTTIYTAGDTTGTDTLIARVTIDGETFEASDSIYIGQAAVGHLQFISATPETIALKNTGGPSRSETSVLVFQITDDSGEALSGKRINFQLSTDVGGLSLSRENAVSDSEGQVQTTVNSGTVPTHVRVLASIAKSDPLVSIVSDELLISTGLPDQNSISLGSDILNPEAWNYNNVEVKIVFNAADHFNNFVPDGTVVYFTSEGGSIDDSCTLENGVCEVTWRSGNPRPSDGRVTYLAFCIGEESFTDMNSNGNFDPDDLFDESTDMGEPFRDDDESGDWTEGEQFWDYDNDGTLTQANGIYNGSLCSEEAEAQGLCTRELIYTQAEGILVLSGSYAVITFDTDKVELDEGDRALVIITIADQNNNPMPSGSQVTITATNGTLLAGSTSFQLPNTTSSEPAKTWVIIEPSSGDGSYGYIEVDVETPFGTVSSNYLSVYDPD